MSNKVTCVDKFQSFDQMMCSQNPNLKSKSKLSTHRHTQTQTNTHTHTPYTCNATTGVLAASIVGLVLSILSLNVYGIVIFSFGIRLAYFKGNLDSAKILKFNMVCTLFV